MFDLGVWMEMLKINAAGEYQTLTWRSPKPNGQCPLTSKQLANI
jgi:hypothetical protein